MRKNFNTKIENFDYETTGKVTICQDYAVKTQEEIDKILKALGDIYMQDIMENPEKWQEIFKNEKQNEEKEKE